MKASLKFRDDQKPLVRAKIPLSIAGLPFFSGFSAGDAKDLQLDLGTAFDSGPGVRISYRPNSTSNPFSLVLKTGIGALGSPFASPMSVHVEFNLLGRATPAFSIHFKPRLGDFGLRKVVASAATSGGRTEVDREEAGGFAVVDLGRAGTMVERALSGVEVAARSVLPLRSRTAVRFRWGVRVPAELPGSFVEKRRVAAPLLVMNKISVEYVGEKKKGKEKELSVGEGSSDIAKACVSVREQLDSLKVENGILMKVVEDLRMEVAGELRGVTGWKVGEREEAKGREVEGRNGTRGATVVKNGRRSEKDDAVVKEGDVNAELRKALMEATGGGA